MWLFKVKKIKKKCFCRSFGICVYRRYIGMMRFENFFEKRKEKCFFFNFLDVSSHLQSFEIKNSTSRIPFAVSGFSSCRKRNFFSVYVSESTWPTKSNDWTSPKWTTVNFRLNFHTLGRLYVSETQFISDFCWLKHTSNVHLHFKALWPCPPCLLSIKKKKKKMRTSRSFEIFSRKMALEYSSKKKFI